MPGCHSPPSYRVNQTFRVLFQKTTLETLIFMCLRCYQKELSISLVCPSALSHSSYARPTAPDPTIDTYLFNRQGNCQNREGPWRRLCRGCCECTPDAVFEKPDSYSDEMQVSFEFKSRKAMPVIRGVVIASEHEALVLEVCDKLS